MAFGRLPPPEYFESGEHPEYGDAIVNYPAGTRNKDVERVLRAKAVVSKYNPNHDQIGRFASAGGYPAASSDRSQWPDYIKALDIPPAWTDVHYNENPDADLLAIGKDAKGRAQYVYSERFKNSQAEAKFERVKELRQKFEAIGNQNAKNLKSKDPEVREQAEVVALIMETGIRPGSEEDRGGDVKAYGATTLEGRHVVGTGADVSLQFTGKKGVSLSIPISDRSVASMLTRRAKASGPDGQLFPNVDRRSLSDYVSTLDGGGFHTKDFRTAVGTTAALRAMEKVTAPTSPSAYKKAVRAVAKVVSTKLGNTPVVALQSYIDPSVFGGWRRASRV